MRGRITLPGGLAAGRNSEDGERSGRGGRGEATGLSNQQVLRFSENAALPRRGKGGQGCGAGCGEPDGRAALPREEASLGAPALGGAGRGPTGASRRGRLASARESGIISGRVGSTTSSTPRYAAASQTHRPAPPNLPPYKKGLSFLEPTFPIEDSLKLLGYLVDTPLMHGDMAPCRRCGVPLRYTYPVPPRAVPSARPEPGRGGPTLGPLDPHPTHFRIPLFLRRCIRMPGPLQQHSARITNMLKYHPGCHM